MIALADRFTPPDNDPLLPVALLADEVRQRRESGYDVDTQVVAANALDTDDHDGILAVVDDMEHARRGDWPWEEPEGLEAIRASLPSAPPVLPVDPAVHARRVASGWTGRIVGCNMGKPIEWGDHWTPEHIEEYLRLADAYPLRDYVPLLDPMPARFDLNGSWTTSALGRLDGSARDDDIDYAILALHLLETHGAGFTTGDVGDAWTELLPIRQTYTAERAAYRNLVDGLRPPRTATFRNPYREWIGAQIRADVYGYVRPGDPWAAAALAWRDAALSHTGNGVYGAMWAAGLVSAAFGCDSAREALDVSLTVVPPGSRLAAVIRHVLALHDAGVDRGAALAEIRHDYGRYSWVHTLNNAALVVLGLLWGDGDFTTAVGGTIMGGWDTDSSGATTGSVAGILAGADGIPPHLTEPLHDRVRSALFGFDDVRISDLAARTVAVSRAMAAAGDRSVP